MIQVQCRCHGRLNELLPPSQRWRVRTMHLKQEITLQQLLIPLHIPHPEVDLVMVNGAPARLDYCVRHGDQIHIYPDIGDIDDAAIVPLRVRPLPRARFILDVHLGRLARRLRLLGLDCWYRSQMDDRAIVRLARIQERVILTRDRGLLQRVEVSHGYYVRAIRPEAQLREVLARFEPGPWLRPLSRCMRCNGLIETMSGEEVQRLSRPDLEREFSVIYRCVGCHQLYWQGSHYEQLRKYVDQLLS
ncbi:Mut7-C RNAse domain-containing protein [Marinobacterium rhizophilum]|uniref:Mut7-C RNAse domain-containing protein n=1 Tax=Marinobacterium rhizophilum TaxID=420402 RepID=UPI00036AB40B|nr:Mut7-C RNAse domain-containing protein [Marinobacterium rhizophilum]